MARNDGRGTGLLWLLGGAALLLWGSSASGAAAPDAGASTPAPGPPVDPPAAPPGRYFTWADMLRSGTAARNQIDNRATPSAYANLLRLVRVVLDPAQARYRPGRIEVSNGYRSPAVNALTPGSADNSGHMRGTDADIVLRRPDGTVLTSQEAARVFLNLGVPFDTLIWYAPGDNHLHVAYRGGTGTRYIGFVASRGADPVPRMP